jgi:hypothetical protein
LPIGVDELIDERSLFVGRLKAVVDAGFEVFEFGGVFAEDDFGFGVDSGFGSVHCRTGTAGLGTGPS